MSINRLSWNSLPLGLILLGLAFPVCASMNVELLRADFNDKPLNTQIGTGGASVGEPVSVQSDLNAQVRAAPFSTPSLHFITTTTAARYARFDFIDGEEIRSGELHISFAVRTPPVADRFRVGISDQLTATAFFGGLDFRADGTIYTVDSPTAIGNYLPNEDLRVQFVFQVVGGTYDLFINGVRKFDSRVQGSAPLDKGIGALFFGFPASASTSGEQWIVDDINVVRPAALLNADFDDKPLGVQIGSGGAEVGEPIGLVTVDGQSFTAAVEAGHFATPALRLAQASVGWAQYAVFEFLNRREVVSGELRISYRLLTAPVSDSLVSNIREQNGSSLVFSTLRFESDGSIEAFDANGNFTIGSYLPGDALLVEFRYSLDAGTYDIYINRELALDDHAHGITATGRGIGRVSFGTDASTVSSWVVDDLYVYQPDVVFQDEFD